MCVFHLKRCCAFYCLNMSIVLISPLQFSSLSFCRAKEELHLPEEIWREQWEAEVNVHGTTPLWTLPFLQTGDSYLLLLFLVFPRWTPQVESGTDQHFQLPSVLWLFLPRAMLRATLAWLRRKIRKLFIFNSGEGSIIAQFLPEA